MNICKICKRKFRNDINDMSAYFGFSHIVSTKLAENCPNLFKTACFCDDCKLHKKHLIEQYMKLLKK